MAGYRGSRGRTSEDDSPTRTTAAMHDRTDQDDHLLKLPVQKELERSRTTATAREEVENYRDRGGGGTGVQARVGH